MTGSSRQLAAGAAPRRVLLVYNTDYDAELCAADGVDVSAVREAAEAVAAAASAQGLGGELVGVHGRDLDRLAARLRDDPPDLVFNLCESMNGDARNEVVLPALLDMLRIPYTGPGPLAIALCLHKDRAKEILRARGVPTPPARILASAAELDAPPPPGDLDDLDYPCFLKLAHEDASIGIEASNVVCDGDELAARARALLSRYRQPVIAERFIDGREVNVTLVGNGDHLEVLPLHEIDFSAMPAGRPHIVSYAAKWDEAHEDYGGTVPVPIRDASPRERRTIEETARAAFLALGLRDFGRVDVRVDAGGVAWVIDVNPNCDLSPEAGVARAARAAGLDYPALIGRICEVAWRRHVDADSRDRAA